mgnify:CR=1 FL=1
MQQNHPFLKNQVKSSRFKIQVEAGGDIRWADADKVFAHLMERYMKTIPNGDKPQPYKEKVEGIGSKATTFTPSQDPARIEYDPMLAPASTNKSPG